MYNKKCIITLLQYFGQKLLSISSHRENKSEKNRLWDILWDNYPEYLKKKPQCNKRQKRGRIILD